MKSLTDNLLAAFPGLANAARPAAASGPDSQPRPSARPSARGNGARAFARPDPDVPVTIGEIPGVVAHRVGLGDSGDWHVSYPVQGRGDVEMRRSVAITTVENGACFALLFLGPRRRHRLGPFSSADAAKDSVLATRVRRRSILGVFEELLLSGGGPETTSRPACEDVAGGR